MYYPRNTSPAPSRESFVTREADELENISRVVEGSGRPQLEVRSREVHRRFFTTRPWTLTSALTYIAAGGRFDFDKSVDFESQASRTAAGEAQATRDWLLSLQDSSHAA